MLMTADVFQPAGVYQLGMPSPAGPAGLVKTCRQAALQAAVGTDNIPSSFLSCWISKLMPPS